MIVKVKESVCAYHVNIGQAHIHMTYQLCLKCAIIHIIMAVKPKCVIIRNSLQDTYPVKKRILFKRANPWMYVQCNGKNFLYVCM